jgi:hypothetical protein
MKIEEMFRAIRVVAHFNPPMRELLRNFEAGAHYIDKVRAPVEASVRTGSTVFESLAHEAPRLADSVHDFTYLVLHPHSSVIAKNIAREEVAKALFNIV